MPAKVRLLTVPAGAAGLMLLASACTPGPPHQASAAGARPPHSTAAAPASRPALSPAASQPALSPAASQPAATASPGAGTTAPAYTGPHFTTPQAAMTYLAAAYNSDDTTALHAVTGQKAFTSLHDMRASGLDLQLMSCWPRPTGDYVCSVRYTTPASSPHPGTGASRVAMVIAAPALNPGWYMYQFLSGCD